MYIPVTSIFLIGLGGAIGTMLRYCIALFVRHFFSVALFPIATFVINLTGCFIIGVCLGLFKNKMGGNILLQEFLMIGFCGGYTTFSAFSLENLLLIQQGAIFMAIAYILLSVILGILLTFLGFYLVSHT